MNDYKIPYNKASLAGKEMDYMAQAIQGNHISGDGPFTRKCHAWFEENLGIKKALLTTSCTHALEMIAMLLDIQPGDEVILPAFTFVSTVNAFVLRGARPVFIDVRPDTLNMDETRLEDLISERTKAIMPVHYAGVGCEMEALMEIAARYHIPIVEDNAQGLFGKYKGKDLGSFGLLAAQSFHETKNITCGEGGALFINDPAYIERAEILREKGTNRSRFFRGQVDKYTWVDMGSSYLPSDILAGFLYAQLENHTHIQADRKRIWETYQSGLEAWARQHGVSLPVIPAHTQQPYHLFYMLLPSLEARTALIRRLAAQGILAVFHYQPLHLSDMGLSFGGKPGDCSVTEDICDRLLRLPLYRTLSEEEQQLVIDTIVEFNPLSP